MIKPKLTYIWHMYHNQLVTAIFYSSPIKKRREQIRINKPPSEHKLRFHLLKLIKGKIPASITKTIWDDYHKGCRYDFANHKSVIALHKKECKNCPWNGQTIFPVEED